MPHLLGEKATAFPLDIDGGVLVPIVNRPAVGTGPFPIAQGQLPVKAAAIRAELATWEEPVDLHQGATMFPAVVFEDADELAKAQVGYLAAPQGLHAGEVQVLDEDRIVLRRQRMSRLVVKLPAEIGDGPVELGQGQTGTAPPVRTLLLSGQRPVRLADGPQVFSKRLRHADAGPGSVGQKLFQPEIEARGLTRRNSIGGETFRFDRKSDPEVPGRIPTDGDGLDGTVDGPGAVEAVDRLSNPDAVRTGELPPGLLQSEGAVLGRFPERRRAHHPLRLLLLAQAAVFEEQIEAALDPFNDVLHSLGAERPPFGAQGVAQKRQTFFQAALAQVLAESAIVAFVQRDGVIPYLRRHPPLPIQPPVALGGVELEFVRLTSHVRPCKQDQRPAGLNGPAPYIPAVN